MSNPLPSPTPQSRFWIGIDLGITLVSAENLRTGRVGAWFMRNREIPAAMGRVGLVAAAQQP